VKITTAALSNLKSTEASARLDHLSVSAPFTTAYADIHATRRDMRKLAAKLRARNDRTPLSLPDAHVQSHRSPMPMSNVEGLLPADWSLAFMATTADMPVTDLWSAYATASTSWALSTAVVWLWPTLGALLLLVVVHRVHKWRARKGVSVHPHYEVPATGANAAENALDMQANPCTAHNSFVLPLQPWDSRTTGVRDQRSSSPQLRATNTLPASSPPGVEFVGLGAECVIAAEQFDQPGHLHTSECRYVMSYPDPDTQSNVGFAPSTAPSEPGRATPPLATSMSRVLPTNAFTTCVSCDERVSLHCVDSAVD